MMGLRWYNVLNPNYLDEYVSEYSSSLRKQVEMREIAIKLEQDHYSVNSVEYSSEVWVLHLIC